MNKCIYFIIVFGFTLTTACTSTSKKMPPETNTDKKTEGTISVEIPDHNLLVGDWLRADANYKLSITNSTIDNKLEAAYYNPKPIHVGRSEWLLKDNKLFLVIELQDINYPGSTYTLLYYPNEDQLIGNYFQAVEGINYDVGFVREK
jgi:hypothetical protein